MNFADHLFKGRHFDHLIIGLCVRWYVRFKLSYRDLIEIMAERGLSMAHTTIMRWVIRFIPVFEQRRRKYAKPVGRSWRVDEAYIKVKGQWVYLYRAVYKEGQTVDFYLSEHRDIEAAKALFRKATYIMVCQRRSRWTAIKLPIARSRTSSRRRSVRSVGLLEETAVNMSTMNSHAASHHVPSSGAITKKKLHG